MTDREQHLSDMLTRALALVDLHREEAQQARVTAAALVSLDRRLAKIEAAICPTVTETCGPQSLAFSAAKIHELFSSLDRRVDVPAVDQEPILPAPVPAAAAPSSNPVRTGGGVRLAERDQLIVEALKDGPLTAAEITKAFHGAEAVTQRELSVMWTRLRRLVHEGRLPKDEVKRYRLPAPAPAAVADPRPSPPLDLPSHRTPFKTTSASGVALRQPPVPKAELVTVQPADAPWWMKAKPGEMTAAAQQEQARMSTSPESMKVPSNVTGMGSI